MERSPVSGSSASQTTTWPARAAKLRPVREHVQDWLLQLRFPGQTTAELVVAVNEAVTNAVLHAYPRHQADPTFLLTLWCENAMACIAVQDQGRWRPPTETPIGGYGIVMMRGLVHDVDIDGNMTGTRVTLRHPLPIRAPLLRAGVRAALRNRTWRPAQA